MKLSALISCRGISVLLCLGAWLPAWADDTLILKTGEKFVGTVVEDAPAGVKFQIRTGTIKETKFYARDRVDRIERPKPDDVALKDIQSKMPVPSLLDIAGYRKLIDATDRFLRDFPESQHRATVQKIAEELKGEFDKVSAGALKLNGKWISAEDRKAHQENIDAEIELSKILQLGEGGKFLEALRALDDLKLRFPKTRAYANSVEVSSKMMISYGQSLMRALEDRKLYEAAYAERKARLTEAELRAVENEAAQRQAWVASQNQREKTAGVKWMTIDLTNLDNIQEGIDYVRKQLIAHEKEKLKVDQLKLETDALYEAENLLAQGQLEAAEMKLREALRSKSKVVSAKDPHTTRVLHDLNLAREAKSRAATADLEKAKGDAAGTEATGANGGKAASAEQALDLLMAAERPKSSAKSEEADAPAAKGKSKTTKSSTTKPSAKSKTAAKAKSSSEEESEEGEGEPAGKKAKRPRPELTASASEESEGPSFTLIMGAVLALLAAVTGGIYYFTKVKGQAGGGEE